VTAQRRDYSVQRRTKQRESGQVLVEFSLVCIVMAMFVCGMIDLGRAVFIKQVIVNLSREGSSLASRGTTLAATTQAVVDSSAPLTLSTKGCVIVTTVTNTSGVLRIGAQQPQGGTCGSVASKIGAGAGKPAIMPPSAVVIPPSGQTAYVTEVFYQYAPVTPIGSLFSTLVPTTMYDAAYF
jgi:hypothetical protein